ncbi:MAG: hypothetical protein AB7I30_22015 [Isosphaeraceae bacterium]
MTPTRVCAWLRPLVIALLGLVAVVASPRPAVASGCHAPERPVLGISTSWDDPVSPEATATRSATSSPAIGRPPCSGEFPGAPPSGGPGQVATLPIAPWRLLRPSFAWRGLPPEPLLPRLGSRSVDRPPRSFLAPD